MQNKMEKTISLATPWKRAPLALAVTMALGSPALQAQTHIPSLLLDPGIEQIATPVDGKELVIIDGNVEDMATLLKALPYGAEWLVLDSGRDGVVQLAEIASRHKNIRALHLLSHGEDGLLKLGNSELNQQNLTNYRNQLNTLAASMAPGADLLLYGCEVAKTAKGEQFIRALKAATGLDVVASNDVTRDGDWELEVAAGAIDAATLTPEGYAASLDIIAGDGSGGGASGSYYGANGGAGGGDNDTLTGTANPDVMFGDGSGGGGSAYHGPGYNGYGGAGGAGADTLHGGAGDDILFGDGFDGLSAGNFAGGDGGFGGGGGGGSYNQDLGGVGGLFAGDGGDSYAPVGDAGGNGTGSLGGAGATGAYSGYAYGGGGGAWSDSSGAGNGAAANTTQFGVAGVDGSVTPLTVSETGGIGSQREAVKSYVNSGYFTGLASGDGADTLNGGAGSDDLFGLGGADIFQFEITDAPAANGDIDTIHDFVSGTDSIQLFNLGAPIGIIARDNMLSAQTAAPTANDRTLVYTEGSFQLTIVVLGVGNNLTALDVPAVANTAPTVNPSIDGSVAVGGSFTVTENGFDADGQTLTYSYQWKADSVDIPGETGSSFTPTATEAHALITVTVTADDGAGGSATATSASVAVANSNPIFNGTPAISGSASYGSVLSIINTTTTDNDSDSVSLSYQWQADGVDIFAATGSTYTLSQADAHALITARVTANDGNGGSDIMTTAAVMIANSNPTFTGTPTISGSAAVGSQLSITNTATTDGDGDTTTLGYQWQANGVDIVGATSATFTPTADQAHTSITVIVTADDGNGGSTPVTTAGVAVANSDPSFNGTPTISGGGTVGSLLSISNTATTDVDTDTVTLSYQWQADGVDIVGATGSTYTLAPADAHALITVVITADDGNGGSSTTTSAGFATANDNPVFTSTPTISGTAAVGSPLSIINTATTDTDGDTVTLTYQWKADGSNIVGATGATFTPTADQSHATISVTVTADDGHGGSVPVTTAGVTMANANPTFTATPTISGIAAVGSTLNVTNTATSDADGDSTTLSYQWQVGGVDIVGATSPSFTPTADQAHTVISVTVAGDDGNGGTVTASSAGVTVANTNPTFIATPTISGTAAVGSTLSAINTATNDIDGDTTTLSYQWQANGVDIAGATGASFIPTADQAHASITVTVTGDDGNGGTVTASSTGVTMANANPAFIATPTISGTAAVGSTLSAINTATSDTDGDSTTLSYQWQASGVNIAGATGASFIPTADQAHASITVTVTADDGNGGTVTASSAGVTMANANPTFTATPTISGTAAVGSTLSAINTATSDVDGDSTTLSYQWQAGGVNIVGATSANFTPTADQAHAVISVTVTANDGNGGTVTASSAGVTMANANPTFIATPTISGTAAVGSTLSAINTATNDVDGDTTTLSYQWQAGGANIAGATGASFIPTADQAHAVITVTVTGTDSQSGTTSVTTAGVTVANANPTFIATPGISGIAAVGSTLSVTNTTTSDADGDSTTLSYQWQAGGVNIAGATGASFIPTEDQAHASITVIVTGDDGNGGTVTASSTGVTMANANPTFTATPTISGIAAVGSTLSAINTATTDTDGDTTTLSYQWQAGGVDIAGATGASFIPTADQAHASITVIVTGDDGNGGTVTASSAGVTVANANPAFIATPTISGTAAVGSTLNAINTATSDVDGDSTTLSYQWQAGGADIAGATGASFIPTADQAHASITVTVTADDGNGGTVTASSAGVTVANANPGFIATPSIGGIAAVGSTLSAINTATTDVDGDSVSLSYQWQANGADITGATSASFTPTIAQAHAAITVIVTGNDGNGGSTTATSAGVTVANIDPVFAGTPGISGTAVVGSPLSVTNTATTDADGDTVILAYQWQADGSNIAGATGASFTPTADQAHALITVTVTGNDGNGGSASVSSAGVTVANSTPMFTTTPSISGSAVLGSVLSIINTATTDADGDAITLSYQWQADGVDIAGAAGDTYTPTPDQSHAAITVIVTANDGNGGTDTVTTGSLTIGNNSPTFTATPTISGPAAVGSTLSAINTATSDDDGDTVGLSYQWKANGANITGATGASFIPTAAEAHALITVTVTADDGNGGTAIASSSGVTIANNDPFFVDSPTISGSAAVGSSLNAINTATNDIDGDSIALSYQWQANGVDIAGATGASFTPTPAQAHASITVNITGADGYGGSTPTVTTSAVLVADSSPIFIATPSITGSATLGSSLGVINTATTDADGDTVVLAYQWQADGSNIAGATGASFSPTAAEAHAAITVSVAANDGYGGITVANSAGVTVANNAPGFDSTPTISGTEIVGSTLSANAITTDIDGDTVTLTYQWQADGVDIPGAKGKGMTFTPMAAQAHAEITVTVTGNDGHGGITSATSTGVTMANSSPVFETMPVISGTIASGSTLSLIDIAVTDVDGDATTLSYQWQLNGVDIEGATLETYEVINSDRGDEISTIITADDGNGSAAIISTEKVAIPAAPATDSGAISWLSGLMGMLLLAGRRLSSRSKRRN